VGKDANFSSDLEESNGENPENPYIAVDLEKTIVTGISCHNHDAILKPKSICMTLTCRVDPDISKNRGINQNTLLCETVLLFSLSPFFYTN